MDTPANLHDFHLRICRHAAGNVAICVDDLVIPDEDRELYSGLVEFLHAQVTPGDTSVDLLLNDGEFDRLRSWSETLPSPNEGMHEWASLGSYLGQKAVYCVSEIRERLSKEWSSEWSKDALRFCEELGQERLPVTKGVDLVWAWSNDICRYLRAMGCDEFLPRPEGHYATPTTRTLPPPPRREVEKYLLKLSAVRKDPSEYGNVVREALESLESDEEVERLAGDEHIVASVESMRWAIKQGGDASGHELIRRVTDYNQQLEGAHQYQKKASNRQLCYIALHILAKLGEHTPRESKHKPSG